MRCEDVTNYSSRYFFAVKIHIVYFFRFQMTRMICIHCEIDCQIVNVVLILQLYMGQHIDSYSAKQFRLNTSRKKETLTLNMRLVAYFVLFSR